MSSLSQKPETPALIRKPGPTPEQARVTGKTTTAVAFAQARPDERMLYMAFNASIAAEARTRFPKWVECRTMHSLAYQAIVPKLFASLGRPDSDAGIEGWNEKLGDMRPLAIARIMNISPRLAKQVKDTLDAWLCSADEVISAINIPDDLNLIRDNTR